MDKETFGFEPFQQETLRTALKKELDERKSKNPSYSLRAFAKNLEIGHSSLSEIITGHRRVSPKTLERLLKKLNFSEIRTKTIRESHEINPNGYQQVSEEQIENTAAWYYDCIIELTNVENFKPDVDWVADSLGLDSEKVKAAIEVLQKFGSLDITKDKWRSPETGTTTVGSRNKAKFIIEKQKQNLDRQIDVLVNRPPEVQSQVGLTIAADPEDLPEVRQRIYKFLRETGMYLGRKNSKPKEVYRLNIGLFPQTQISDDK